MGDRKGFTLIQLIVVIIILGLMASFIIPNFINSIEKTKAQTAENNLLAIAAAEQKFSEDWGSYCIATGGNPDTASGTLYCGDSLPDFNANFHMSMNDNEFTYSCTSGFSCTAKDTNFTPTITLTLNSGIITCTSGAVTNGPGCPG